MVDAVALLTASGAQAAILAATGAALSVTFVLYGYKSIKGIFVKGA